MATYPRVSLVASSPGEFIGFWSRLYAYPNEQLYSEHINKKRFAVADIESLYLWKNGMIPSERKRSTIGTITAQLELVNQLKLSFDQQKFDKAFFGIAAIWRLFLLHIIDPARFPIFDQHVARAYVVLDRGVIEEIPTSCKKKWAMYHDRYLPFFDRLRSHASSAKKIDEALWVFGKWVKTPVGIATIEGRTADGTATVS